MATAQTLLTAAKIADKIETLQIIGLYVKDTIKMGLSTAAKWANTAATAAHTVATTIATGATIAFGAAVAFLTSPIGLVILAIGALIAITVLIVKNWDVIKEFFSALWKAIKDIFSGIGQWFSDKFTAAKEAIQSTWSGVTDFFDGIGKGITGAFSGIAEMIGGTFEKAWSLAKQPINWIIEGINTLISGVNKLQFDIPSWIPGVGGEKFGINIPLIPKLAKGATIDRATLALIGEGNVPETVVPHNKSARSRALLAEAAQGVGMTVLNKSKQSYSTIEKLLPVIPQAETAKQSIQPLPDQQGAADQTVSNYNSYANERSFVSSSPQNTFIFSPQIPVNATNDIVPALKESFDDFVEKVESFMLDNQYKEMRLAYHGDL